MPDLNTIPRAIVRNSLQNLRFPLTVAERVTNRSRTSAWPPTLAFESFEAGVKQVIGTVLGDGELVGEGRLQQARRDELCAATRNLREKAAAVREQAASEFEQRREQAEERRADVEDQLGDSRERIEERKADEVRAAGETASRRKAAATKSAQAVAKTVAREQRAADRTRIREESAAVEAQRQALDAARRVENLEEAKQAVKSRRKA